MSLAFGSNPDQYAPLQLHLLAGGTMLGAFFIATDPVSTTTSHQGKLIYGAGIGVLIYLIRSWGNYPDAVAFSVLLMNFAVPFIDHYTPPRTYGHHKPDRKSTRLNSSHVRMSYAVFCFKKKKKIHGSRCAWKGSRRHLVWELAGWRPARWPKAPAPCRRPGSRPCRS